MKKLYIDTPMYQHYSNLTTKKYHCHKKLGVQEISNGYILPAKKHLGQRTPLCGNGGVLTSQLEFVQESAQLGYHMENRVCSSYHFSKKDTPYIDQTVIYANHFIKHWGHFLIDVIGRLWYPNKKHFLFVFTATFGKNITIDGPFLEFLHFLGISQDDILIINQPTKFKKIIIPESSIYPGKYYTKEYQDIFQRVIQSCPIEKTNITKLYFSRKNFSRASKKEAGESAIEEFFNQNGFTSISPEKYSLKSQINYIRNAKEIVAISGTLPHNIMFAKKNTKFMILNKTYSINYHQFLLNEASMCDTTFIDVHKSLLPILYGLGPFIIKITPNLYQFAKDHRMKLPKVEENSQYLRENFIYFYHYLITYRGRVIKDPLIQAKKLWNFYKKR